MTLGLRGEKGISKKDEIRRFLEDRISELKKEIEYYEYLLALMESGYTKREEEVEEIEHNGKVIGIVKRGTDSLELSLLFKAPRDPDIQAFLQKQVKLLVPNAEILFEGNENIQKIVIRRARTGRSMLAGLLEALRISVVELYESSKKE